MQAEVIPTPIGPLRAVWNDEQNLVSLTFLRSPTPNQNAARESSSRALQLRKTLEQYFASGELEWELTWLDWSSTQPFSRAVYETCYRIPAGSTLTYGELARQVGRPQAARAVGNTMARNPWPLLIPCHRVIGSTGQLTGYSGAGGIATKRRLLELEQARRPALVE